MTQRPYTREKAFNTVQDETVGRPYSWLKRGSGLTNFPTGPLLKATLNLQSVTPAEYQVLKDFFLTTCQAQWKSFVFLDPGGNLVNFSEDFSNVYWTANKTAVTLTSTGITDPFGGTRATRLTATSTNSNLAPYVLPSGGASGFILNASVYARAVSGGQTLSIGFVDSGFSVLGSQTYALPAGKWKRIDYTIQLATASNIRVLIGGFGTWNNTAIDFFGPQCVPMTGPGSYIKSPDDWGYRANMRFDTDTISGQYTGVNEITVSLPVQEINV